MNMAKKLVLAAGLTLLGGAAAFGEYARGYFNNWANHCQLTRPEDGNYYSGTLQAHAGDNAWATLTMEPAEPHGDDDAKFDTAPTAGSVTQTATANIGNATEKFFKAVIEVDVPNNEDP